MQFGSLDCLCFILQGVPGIPGAVGARVSFDFVFIDFLFAFDFTWISSSYLF